RVIGTALSLGLAAYWLRGYRRGEFSGGLEARQARSALLGLHVIPGNPLLPLLGIAFRGLYGGPLLAFARYGLWMLALFVAHAGWGQEQMDGDVSRAMGTALAPILAQSLMVALR